MRFRRALPAKSPGALSSPERLPGAVLFACARGKLSPEEEQSLDDRTLLRALVPWLASAVDACDEQLPALVGPEAEREVSSEEASERERLEEALVAFADMLARLDAGQRILTPKQRAWALLVAERYEVEWGEPGRRNRNVPRGREVALLTDAMPRPLTPPGRR